MAQFSCRMERVNVLETVKELIMQYGYVALYGLLAVGIVGVPVPDEILMTFVGYLTSIGWFRFGISLCVSFFGAMTGMVVSYTLGRKVGKPFLWRYGEWIKLTPARLSKAESWFRKYGMWTVSFGYFVPGVRHFTCYLAGVSSVGLGRYLLYAGSGALIWCTAFITLGRFIGQSIDTIMPLVHKYMGLGALAVSAVIVCAAYVAIRLRKRMAE